MSKRRFQRHKGTFGKDKSIGYGLVARWSDGTLGWAVPAFVYGRALYLRPHQENLAANMGVPVRFEYCRITIEAVTDSLDRPIVRYVRPKETT